MSMITAIDLGFAIPNYRSNHHPGATPRGPTKAATIADLYTAPTTPTTLVIIFIVSFFFFCHFVIVEVIKIRGASNL